MARRKAKRASSGAPGIQNGPGIGPALNPLTIKQRFIDGTVAFEAERENTPWNRFWRDEKAVARFARPVRSRMSDSGASP